MAIRGVNLRESEDYILKSDPAHPDNPVKTDEKPTIFRIGNLTAGDRVELGDMVSSPSMKDGTITMSLRRVNKAYEVVRKGLKGWDNFIGFDGNEVKFKEETAQSPQGAFLKVASAESLLHLPQEAIIELSNAILDKNGMRSELEKKFDGASSLSDASLFGTGLVTDAPLISNENEDALSQPSSASAPSKKGTVN
jgi:hypothetical protein